MTNPVKPTHEAMVRFARPMVQRGDDWQQVQWELLNHFEGLTNCDEDEEATRNAIRECEDEMAEEAWNKMPPRL